MELQNKKAAIIIDLFLKLKDNSVPGIIQYLKEKHQLELEQQTVHHYLNKYLNQQING